MEKLKEIIRNSNMSTRPEYYSGRGATMSDLNSEILEKIYNGIVKEYNINAGKSFVTMVQDIKVLSATTFLQELYSLFNNNWKYRIKKQHACGISVPKNKDGEYDESSALSGMFGIMASMSNSGRDDTDMIRGQFLYSRGIKSNTGRVYYGNEYREFYY